MNTSRQNNFDFLRFAAASLVILSHSFMLTRGRPYADPLWQLSHGQVSLGTLAVAIFFVISGFLIAQSFEHSRSAGVFFANRLLRLIPGLFVSLLFCVFVIGPIFTDLSLSNYFSNLDTYRYIERNVSLLAIQFNLPGVFAHNPHDTALNGVIWSLRYEMIGYVLVLCLGLLGWLRLWVVGILYALLLLTPVGGPEVLQLTHTLMRFFLAGMVFYLGRHWIPIRADIALAGVAALFASFIYGGYGIVFATLGAYVVFYLSFTARLSVHGFARKGDFSYGLYIYAYPVQQALVQLSGNHMTPWAHFLIAFPVTLLFAWLSWHLVEKQALKLKRKPVIIKSSFEGSPSMPTA